MRGPLLPGVWLGVWKIVSPWRRGYFGAHHAAIALSLPEERIEVTELLGWRREGDAFNARNKVVTQPAPEYAAFSGYRWILLAGQSDIDRFRAAIAKATSHLDGRMYFPADSNRFIGDVLWHARYRLSRSQRAQLGWVPDLRSPHI